MKKSIILFAMLAGAAGANAQQIIWADYVGTFGITVYAPPNPFVPYEQTGNTSYDLSSQTGGLTVGADQTYTGQPLGGSAIGTGPTAYGNGNLFTIGLYAAPGANNASVYVSGTLIATALFDNSGGTGVGNAGINGNGSAGAWLQGQGGNAVAFPVPTPATIGLVAWYNGNGSLSNPTYTYATSPEDGNSSVETISTVGGIGSPPGVTYNLGQEVVPGDGIIQSFDLYGYDGMYPVPEPSTMALGVIGASAFLFRCRK